MGYKLFEKNQAYSVLKNSLESEIKALNRQYAQDSIMYAGIKMSNDSLQGELRKAKFTITGMETRYADIEVQHRIIIDSLEKLHDTLLYAVILDQTDYVYQENDTSISIPTPVIRQAIKYIAENKMFRFQIDTLLSINKKYREHTLGLEKLIIGRDEEIQVVNKMLVNRNTTCQKLNLLTLAQEQEIKKYRRTQTLIIGGSVVVVTVVTAVAILGALK